ncbi:MAG: DUF4142 domain-containing protein [Acetobacter sp.]
MSFLFRHKARVLFPLLVVTFGVGGCSYITPEQPRAPALPALAKPAEFTVADANFVQALNAMDLAQISLAKAATTQAGRSDLALLGATIAKDLSAIQARLAKVATAHSLTLTPQSTPAEQKRMGRVQRARGAVFDRRYIRYFASAHAQVKPVLAKQIATGKDPVLVTIARDVQTRLADYQAAMQ